MAVSLILNIPHSSTHIPQRDEDLAFLPHIGYSGIVEAMKNTKRHLFDERKEAIQKELLAMTDWYTDELFDHGLGQAIIASVSRLVCDTERFSHEEEEPMAQEGMGFCYQKGSRKQVLKDFPKEYQDEVLWRYYAPHHIALTDAVESTLLSGDEPIILDCHSFSSQPLPYEEDQSSPRPDICIGTDGYHTSGKLSGAVTHFFKTRGLSVGFNSPYSGSIVPLRYFRKDTRVQSIMIELNRALYLEPGTSEKNENFQKMQEILMDLQLYLLTSM